MDDNGGAGVPMNCGLAFGGGFDMLAGLMGKKDHDIEAMVGMLAVASLIVIFAVTFPAQRQTSSWQDLLALIISILAATGFFLFRAFRQS